MRGLHVAGLGLVSFGCAWGLGLIRSLQRRKNGRTLYLLLPPLALQSTAQGTELAQEATPLEAVPSLAVQLMPRRCTAVLANTLLSKVLPDLPSSLQGLNVLGLDSEWPPESYGKHHL